MRYKGRALWLGLCCMLLAAGCARTGNTVRGFAMDTVTAITVYKKEDEKAAQAALSKLEEWETQWSADREDSVVYKINHGQAQMVSQPTMEMLQLGQALETKTQGAYTLAVRPLVELWHIKDRTPEEALPTQAQIERAKALCRQAEFTIQPQEDGSGLVTAQEGAGLDLGSMAKGKAADMLKAYLQEQGVQDALIDLGGNVCIVGDRAYEIGIQDPRNEQSIFALLKVQGKSVVTSGDYQRYVEIEQTRYHHILDACTGRPANNGLISVTIVGEAGMVCDALSTAVFLAGEQKGLALVKAYGVEAVLVKEDKKVIVTDGLKDSFTLQGRGYTLQ